MLLKLRIWDSKIIKTKKTTREIEKTKRFRMASFARISLADIIQ